MQQNQAPSTFIIALLPWLFVPMWATGFLVAKYTAPFSDPFTFLIIRYALTLLALGIFCAFSKTVWPKQFKTILHAIISGACLHGIYIGATWWSIFNGLPPAVSSLISGLQPLVIAIVATQILREKLIFVQILGIVLGFIGVVLVLLPKISGFTLGENTVFLIAVGFIAMLGISAGTLWQKIFIPHTDLRALVFWQYIGALLITLPFEMASDSHRFGMNIENLLAMAWAVLGLSIGAVSLYLVIIRHGAVAKLSSMLFLVPPCTAILAYFLFHDKLELLQIFGMLITAIGVALTTNFGYKKIK